ncbi:MAG: hypothetical protein QG620_144 [Patescibacteria group bacterium]|nr:hypothetical protein [Patescibacteria group bacterium]
MKESKYEGVIKKISPKEIIEKTDPAVEHAYLRVPGKEMVDVSKVSSRDSVDVDMEKTELATRDYSGNYSTLHEHSFVGREEEPMLVATPSGDDLGHFLSQKFGSRQNAMHIAQRDIDTGEVCGYITLRKTKSTQLIEGDLNPFFGYDMSRAIADLDNGKSSNKALDEIVKGFHLQIRYTPAKGFRYESKKLRFVKEDL